MTLLDRVKRANRPGPPEHSVTLRLASGGAVVTGIAACWAEAEISPLVAVTATVLVTIGMLLSYRTRSRPRPWVKVLLALGAVVAFFWFFHELTAQGLYDINTVEDPLAVLFVWIQVTHAFDVPARRDLAFSLAGSASLMAVAAAQAIDLSFGVYALTWIGFGLWGLVGLWQSASGGGRMSWRALIGTLFGVSVLAGAVLVALPAPHVAGKIDFPAAAGSGLGVSSPGGLTGDSGNATEPSQPGSPAGRDRVGGYLGFSARLNTALRGSLGNTVVMRVRADRPSYWIGETYETWDGENWKTTTQEPTILSSGSPFFLPSPPGAPPGGQGDLQTFYITNATPNLVFHADEAREVWFPAHELFYESDGSIVSPIGLGSGAIYTVESQVQSVTPAQLTAAEATDPTAGLSASRVRQYTQLPHSYPQAQALATSVIAAAGATTTYAKVQALIAWIGKHTKYSTNIPPLAPGQDTVDEFLFGNRLGFCEQISTALAVMLRTVGVPAREAVGYVPGPYNPITDLWEVQAKDAHAWVQVWFPGYGWQSFDPTAVVPVANPAPGATLVHETSDLLRQVPVVPVAAGAGAVALVLLEVRRRRRRPANWMALVARSMEKQGARAKRPRAPSETLVEYAGALDDLGSDMSGSWRALAWLVEEAAYGNNADGDDTRHQALQMASTLRIDRSGRRGRVTPPAPAPHRSSSQLRAGAGSSSSDEGD